MSTSPRAYIFEHAKPAVPASFKIEDRIPTLNTLSQPTAWIEYTTFSPLPEAPLASVAAVADLCLLSNLTDLTAAQNAIDEFAWDTYIAIAESDKFYNVTASKDVWEDTYLGWRINLTVAYTPEEPEE